MSSARAWIATVAVVAVAVFVLTGGFSGGDTPKPATARTPSMPRTATLPLVAQRRAEGAQGTVTIQSVKTEGHPRFRLTIKVEVPKQRYGVWLWSSRRKWSALYAGYPGTNVQTMTISARRLIRYRWLNVGQQVVHIRRGRMVYKAYRHMLRVATPDLLNALLEDHAAASLKLGTCPSSTRGGPRSDQRAAWHRTCPLRNHPVPKVTRRDRPELRHVSARMSGTVRDQRALTNERFWHAAALSSRGYTSSIMRR